MTTPVSPIPALPASTPDRRTSYPGLSGLRKAAILIVAMGDELGKKIIQNLPEQDVQRLAEELADLKNIPPDLSFYVVEEFYEMLETQHYMLHGGIDYATRLLVESFGKQRAEDLLELVKRAQEASQGNLSMLQKVDPLHLGKFLDSEHPQTIALVLAHLDPRRASLVLDSLNEERRVEAVVRLAAMRQFSPEMAQKVAVILHRRLENIGDGTRKSYSGHKAVADLLNRQNAEQAKKILEEIEETDPEMALNIRNLMFTFEDLVTIPVSSMREIVAAADKRQLALALRSAREDLRAHVYQAMSSRAVEMLREDMEVMGPVRAREIAGAQQEILNLARTLESEGKIILKLEQGDDLIV
ncbi:flagellar motor switch protein FliG [Paracidobacterium acidisoli]|uniref:Flagellar motor switch protein FliG n=1 Tax=Paracidobacterium acidisoli TaxID=2303751 RepID=A0A372ISM7_9BACT|nr:flagellar motor switch protein FliG [Paracidobacterium acidisoli]MBT9330290.1 flagellar motor switch protein FliG [Paracidobacterium acidisoli]